MMYPANIWIKSNRDPAEFARRSDIHATRSRDAASDAQEREVAGAGSVDLVMGFDWLAARGAGTAIPGFEPSRLWWRLGQKRFIHKCFRVTSIWPLEIRAVSGQAQTANRCRDGECADLRQGCAHVWLGSVRLLHLHWSRTLRFPHAISVAVHTRS